MTALINPYLRAAPFTGVASLPRPAEPAVVYARLPQAPRTGSPVPELTSLWHDPDPGTWGSRAYPGNCSGGLIHAVLRFYAVTSVYDPMSGSGTCREVCRDLGIPCVSGDIHAGQDACEPRFHEAFAFCFIHPPYWRMKQYADDPRDLSRCPTLDAFFERYEQLLRSCTRALVPGGRLGVLMGDYSDKECGFLPLVYHTKRLAFGLGLRQCATDIVRFSHGASSGRKVYASSFVPGLHDVLSIFVKPTDGGEVV